MEANSGIHEKWLEIKLDVLKSERRGLDDAISKLQKAKASDPLSLWRLKKRRFVLRRRIRHIKDMLTPDIIA